MKKHKSLCLLCALLLAGCGAVDDSTETKKPSKTAVTESSSQESVAETSSEESSESPAPETSSESEIDDSKPESTEPDLPDTITPIPGGRRHRAIYLFNSRPKHLSRHDLENGA